MNDNPAIQQYSNGKPVNINISFNISRKQVMQNINPLDPDPTYNFNNPLHQDPITSNKPKNVSYRPLKTPELVQTDRQIYSKDLEFARATEELKRKKKRKRSSGDYTADKTHNFPFYPIELDKSLPTHKRGFTTTVIKKTTSSTKSKKQPIKIDQYLKQANTLPISALLGHEKKVQTKSGKVQKNLKNLLNKLINNEESKRSLPLPSVPSKSKYVQSTSLTSRKMSGTKNNKKRHSKSHMMNKQRGSHTVENMNSSVSEIEAFRNPAILEKLSNFRSNENSILISQIDNMEEREGESPRERAQSEKRIVIKTDQSMECIEEIHNWEKDYYKEAFFDQKQKGNTKNTNSGNNGFLRKQRQKNQQDPDYSDTLLLVETYVKLLNAPDDEDVTVRENYQGKNQANDLRRDKNVNEKVEIYDGSNYINKTDFMRAQSLLKQEENIELWKRDNLNDKTNKIREQRTQVERMLQDFEDKEKPLEYSVTRPMWKKQSQQSQASSISAINQQLKANINIRRIQSREERYGQQQQQQLREKKHLLEQSPLPHMINQQDSNNMTNFRPFISSQMGRQQHSITQSQQRAKVNELKKHQIQKWSNLLEYIKSNMNSQTNTQEVLEQVYEYLSQAKIDLIRQGRNIVEGSRQTSVVSHKKDKLLGNNNRLEEEFTNKLSSQLEKSQNQHYRSNSRELQSFEQQEQNESYSKDKERNRQNSHQDYDQNHQQQVDQQAKSFKQDYESQEQQQSIKFMNLSTIETALRNRFNQLTIKKDKQVQRLQLLLSQNNLNLQQYQQQKALLQKQYKSQTNQILNVKKNIWKGYNQAKGILDKSYINSRIQQEFKGLFYGKYSSNSKTSSTKAKKDRKMMKCLSESYLNKKKIDYKKFIEEQEKKRQQEQQEHVMKRQHGDTNWDDQDEEDQEEEYEHSNDHSNSKDNHYYYNERSDEDMNGKSEEHSEDKQQDHRKQTFQQHSNSRAKSSQYSEPQGSYREESHEKNGNKNKSIDDEFEKISKKLNILKQQHQTVIANSSKTNKNHQIQIHDQKYQISSSSSKNSINSQQPSDISNPHQHINEFTHTRQHYEKQSNSPVMISMSPDSSIYYEQVEKDLPSDDQGDNDYIDENYALKEVKHSQSDEEDEGQDDQQEEQHQGNKKKYQQEEDQDAQNKLLAQEDDYSDEQQQIIARQLSQATKFGSLSSTKTSQPLKNTLQQLEQSEHLQQPKPTSKSSKHTSKQASPEPIDQSLSPATQALYKKLRYLTEEDREDIFEFMFLDLCIQLYQEPCHENKLMNAINKHVAKQYELAKRKKGVKTNLNVVKDYLKRFCGYLVRTNRNVLDNLNVPMGPTAIEMLKYMHENEDFDEEPGQAQGGVTLIVPVSVFDTFERSLLPTFEFQKYYDNEQKQQQRVNFLKNILHIHNKALFDALNEFLDHQRPFRIWGKPFPWKKSSSFTHVYSEQQQQERLKKSAQKVVQACSYVCGLLVDKQESLVGNAKISEGYIEQIREDRISRMLANEMIQSEERWVFYDDEETEVLVEASNYVYNMMLREAMEDLMRLRRNQQERNE